MGKRLRILLIAVVVIVVLLVAAPFLIPVNKFRPTIEQTASDALGRKVSVGDLSLSLLSGSLTAKDLSVGDDPKFSPSPFLTAQSLSVGVEVLPLIFSKTLNVTGITIDEPQVTLLRNPAGQWNYSSLGASAKPATKSSSTASASTPEVSVKKLELKDGKIIVGTTTSQKRNTYDHVTVTASDVSINSKFPVTVSAELPGGGQFKLDGNAGPLDKADTALTPLDAKIHVNSLDLARTGFLDPALGLGGLVDMDSTLASKNGSAETKGNLKLSKALFVQGGSPAGVPAVVEFGTRYDLRKNSGIITPSEVKIGSAVAHLSGNYESRGEETSVDVKLVWRFDARKRPRSVLARNRRQPPQGRLSHGGNPQHQFGYKGSNQQTRDRWHHRPQRCQAGRL